jgi:hypothetical protein
MRKAFLLIAVLALASLATAGGAFAAPKVGLKVKVVPIPGFPHTGYHPGWGAAVKSEMTISGTEYGGFPPPVIGVNVFLPKNLNLHPQGFPTCPAAKARVGECPKSTQAGPAGRALGVVSFGNERVPEEVKIQPYFAPGGGLEFYVLGTTPVLVEILSSGHFTGASGLFGKEFIAEVPLIETVPGAPDASAERISVQLGAALKKRGRTIYYGTVPRSCPKGGFPVKVEVLFAGVGGLSPQTVPVSYKVPCPR